MKFVIVVLLLVNIAVYFVANVYAFDPIHSFVNEAKKLANQIINDLNGGFAQVSQDVDGANESSNDVSGTLTADDDAA